MIGLIGMHQGFSKKQSGRQVKLNWVLGHDYHERLRKVEAAAALDPTIDDALKWCRPCKEKLTKKKTKRAEYNKRVDDREAEELKSRGGGSGGGTDTTTPAVALQPVEASVADGKAAPQNGWGNWYVPVWMPSDEAGKQMLGADVGGGMGVQEMGSRGTWDDAGILLLMEETPVEKQK
jgi:hypothetical protein